MSRPSFTSSSLLAIVERLLFSDSEIKSNEKQAPRSGDSTSGISDLVYPSPTEVSEPLGVRLVKGNPYVKLYSFQGHDFKSNSQLELALPISAEQYDATNFKVFLFDQDNYYTTPGFGPKSSTFYRTFHRYSPGKARIFINKLEESGGGEIFVQVKVITSLQIIGNPNKDIPLDFSSYFTWI